MKRIALEGAINKCSDGEANDWRDKVIGELRGMFKFHNPMDLDCRGREAEMEQELVDFDTAGIAASDIALVMAERPSWGTAMGLQMAWAMHKKTIVVCSSDKPSPWLKNRASFLVKDLDAAILILKMMAEGS